MGRPHDEHLAQLRLELTVESVGQNAQRVERLREKAARGSGEDDVHDLHVREPEVAQALKVGIVDRAGVVGNPIGEVHDGHIHRSRPAA